MIRELTTKIRKMKEIKHIWKGNGWRHHVVYWDSFGEHCTEEGCELNDTD